MDHCFLAAEHGDGAGHGVPHSKIPDSTGSSEVHRRCNCRQVFLVADPRCCCAVQEVSATPWKSNIQRGMSAHHALLQGQCTWLCNFATRVNAALVIPVSSVSCERGFSLQKRVKPYQRSQLLDCSVDNELVLSMKATDYAVLTMKWHSVDNEMMQCWQWNDTVLTIKCCCPWRHQTMQC